MFDFDATEAPRSAPIVVKGGPNYNVYIFARRHHRAEGLALAGATSRNDKWYGLSHLCIESEKKDEKPSKYRRNLAAPREGVPQGPPSRVSGRTMVRPNPTPGVARR